MDLENEIKPLYLYRRGKDYTERNIFVKLLHCEKLLQMSKTLVRNLSNRIFCTAVINRSTYSLSALLYLSLTELFRSSRIHPVIFKTNASEITPCFGKLFRLFILTSTFPYCWKCVLIQPDLNKGDPYHLSYYRPIAVTFVPFKV